MNDIDNKIQAALRRDAAGDALLEKPNVAEELIATFRERGRLFSVFLIAVNFTFTVAAIWAAVEFYQANTVTSQIQLGVLTIALFFIVLFAKIWFWLEIHTNRVLRELKRVELLLISRPPQA